MGKPQSCRICRTADNLKYTAKELRQLNKEQLLLAQATQKGQANTRASKKLLLTTPTLGNICQICDKRIQIFHRLDDDGHESNSDIEVDDVSNINGSLPLKLIDTMPNGDFVQRMQRPETPVIVDDDDMLFNIFMQKFDQLPQHQISASLSHQDTQMSNDFHSTYTPPQSTGGGSEGDETKIIEVLTSRESTPAPSFPKKSLPSSTKPPNPQLHRIVAIIELDDGDDDENNKNIETQKDSLNSTIKFPPRDITIEKNAEKKPVTLSLPNSSTISSNKTYDLDDDDEIVFQKVDNQKESSTTLKKRKRKTYDEKKLRLVACLSLVSSDSESEDSKVVNKLTGANFSAALTPVVKKSFVCKECEIHFPDSESLTVHERIHEGVKCILCKVGFPQVKRLIHHMRRKHREYNGDALSEKPRSGQDSCMTIRLRYMQQITFYECQLCGRIDEVFREHKKHILDKHPNESKSLKDPIIKQLKCPICKVKCGAQYLSLCRHLIGSHEYTEYKSHLRELVHVSSFGWFAARQQEVAKTAKIFQFIKRKTFFFECKICCKVVAGYLHHLRHQKEHEKSAGEKLTQVAPINLSLESLHAPNLSKLNKRLNKNGVSISKNLRNREKLTKLANHSSLENKMKQIGKVKKLSTKISKPEKSCIKVSKFTTKYVQKIEHNKKELLKKPEVEVKKTVQKKLKNKCKQKEKSKVKLPTCDKLHQEAPKKEASKKDKQMRRQPIKAKDIEQKPQVKRVKVKAPIRQIDLQKYKCKYCLKKFKGFRLYNLHVILQHKENEFFKCDKCNKFFTSAHNLEGHIKQCPQLTTASKRKRKISGQASLFENITENCPPLEKKVPDINDVGSVDITENAENYQWLKDLLQLKEPLELSDSDFTSQKSPKTALLNFQCCYCLHFLGNDKNLKDHKKVHHLQCSDIFLRYKPLTSS